MVDGSHSSSTKLNSLKQKSTFRIEIHPATDSSSPSPPPSARSSGLQIPTNFAQHIRSRYMSMISPRSSNYERLEGGHGPSRTGGAKRFAWKKFAIAAVVLIGLVYLFGPRASSKLPWKSKSKQSGEFLFLNSNMQETDWTVQILLDTLTRTIISNLCQ